MKFEAVSIKLTPPPGSGVALSGIVGGPGTRTPGVVRGINFNLENFIVRAFDLLDRSRLSGPGWLRDTRFDLNARLPDGTTSQQQIDLMLRNVLVQRFGLKFHYEASETSGFSLVLARNASS